MSTDYDPKEWITDEGHCATLGLSGRATVRDVKAAFRRLALELHPDKNANRSDANEQFIKVKEAYEYLVPRWMATGGRRPNYGGRGRGRGGGTRASGDQDHQQGPPPPPEGPPRGGGGGDSRGRGYRRPHSTNFNEFRPTARPQFRPPPVIKPDTIRLKLYLTYEEYRTGKKFRVPLTKRKTADEDPLSPPVTKLLEVRIPPGAFPDDVYHGYLVNGPKDEDGQPTITSMVDTSVHFVIADRPDQRFYRDPAFPGCAHLRHIVDVPAADWIALESGAVDYITVKVPSIERAGDYITHRFVKTLVKRAGAGKAPDAAQEDEASEKAKEEAKEEEEASPPSSSLKMVREFRLRGLGLPFAPWSPNRGDLIVYLNVL